MRRHHSPAPCIPRARASTSCARKPAGDWRSGEHTFRESDGAQGEGRLADRRTADDDDVAGIMMALRRSIAAFPRDLACARFRRTSSQPTSGVPQSSKGTTTFGFLFDIDGVIVRGKRLLPSAKEAFRLLTNDHGKFRVPTLFVTNAGNMLRQRKAEQLSQWLEVEVLAEQVLMSHSPLKMFKQFHDKHILVSGQGPVLEIARQLGFTKVTTIDTLRQTFPLLDMVDHKRRKAVPCAFEKYFPKIEAVILFGEPVRWETNLQLIIDVLLSNGHPDTIQRELPYPHLPVLACNMDLQWMAEACMPRFGHGCFMHCLESLYQKVTGRELKYTALIGKPSEITYHHADHLLSQQAQSMGHKGVMTVYCIGDNPETDIYGGNLYNRYLLSRSAAQQQKSLAKVLKQVATTNSATQDIMNFDDLHEPESVVDNSMPASTSDDDDGPFMTEKCVSILVCTGVYCMERDYVTFGGKHISNHNHRDFVIDMNLKQPMYVTQNVLEAVKLVYEKEKFD